MSGRGLPCAGPSPWAVIGSPACTARPRMAAHG